MIINVDDFIRNNNEKLSLNFNENIEKIAYADKVFELSSPMKIEGSIRKDKDLLYIVADVEFSIIDECSRCLEKINVPLKYKISGYLVEEKNYCEDEYEDNDAFVYSGNEINLLDVIELTLDFNLPLKNLCKEDCKGLCTECGANLNKGNCSCNEKVNDEVYIDPRFAKLKDLYK
ncbi:MAG: DUF177 domain-containing protein [Clostridioides sp.]|jgi:uncharacterized protein|nr:DUF177 domain-containing protein [Clostridioides sp.]